MKHEILVKLGVALIALASVISAGTIATTNKAKAVVYKYNDKRLQAPKSMKFYVYHAKHGVNHYKAWDIDVDPTQNYQAIMKPANIQSTSKAGRTLIAPSSSKYDLRMNGIKYRPYLNHITGSWMPESDFEKTFAKGGSYNDKNPGFSSNVHMINGKILTGYKWLYNHGGFGTNTPDKMAGIIGYKNRRYFEENMALNQLDGDGVSVSDPDAASKRVINRVVKALKHWGYSDDKIQRILNRKKMVETYDDTHDDYDVPDFIQKWMYQY